MAAEDRPAKRQKKPNFSDRENIALLEELQARYHVVTQTAKTANVSQKKRQAWSRVTDAVNAVGGQGRTEASVQKRWNDMRDDVKNRPRQAAQTGGGPPDKPAAYEDFILQILNGSCTIDGIVTHEAGDTTMMETHDMGISIQVNHETADITHLTAETRNTSGLDVITEGASSCQPLDQYPALCVDQNEGAHDQGQEELDDTTSIGIQQQRQPTSEKCSTPLSKRATSHTTPRRPQGSRFSQPDEEDLQNDWMKSSVKLNKEKLEWIRMKKEHFKKVASLEQKQLELKNTKLELEIEVLKKKL